jgi:hypothetical protein
VNLKLDLLGDGEQLLLSLNRFERKKNVGLAICALGDQRDYPLTARTTSFSGKSIRTPMLAAAAAAAAVRCCGITLPPSAAAVGNNAGLRIHT